MKIVGLITEYNPFHNGHKYHIEQARKITGADYVIAVMSGNFVQRGAPAFMPKHLRTAMALEGGCDMVIELPAAYATGSAEYFAMGAVSIFNQLSCVDAICFGSECGDISILNKIADVILEEPIEYKESLQANLRLGQPFPLARQHALSDYFKNSQIASILEKPNNTLGIEYIKALKKTNSLIKPFTITRKDSSYHDTELSEKYSSATAIRNIFDGTDSPTFHKLDNQVPVQNVEILKHNYHLRYPVIADDFSLLLRYRLLSETVESLLNYQDMSVELANRILNLRNKYHSYSQFCELLKTKELTYSRISRCMIHIVLNIVSSDLHEYTKAGYTMYAHVLGFRNEAKELFSLIKSNSQIPILTKLTGVTQLNNIGQAMLSQDIYASDLYETIVSHKYQQPFINELTQQIINRVGEISSDEEISTSHTTVRTVRYTAVQST